MSASLNTLTLYDVWREKSAPLKTCPYKQKICNIRLIKISNKVIR